MESCDECELGVGRSTPRATSNFATSIHTSTTPLQNHQPRPFATLLPRQIEPKYPRDGIESRCARYAGAACRRGGTPDGQQEVEEGRTNKKNPYVLRGLRRLCGTTDWAAANVRGQRALRVKLRRCMASDHHRSRFTKSRRRTAQRGRALGLQRNGTFNRARGIPWV
jgi:hypothetical protein